MGETSYLWLMTWFFQVMPIFFFVGGFSNYVACRAYRARGGSTGSFIRSRLDRLLRPSLVFLGIWAVVQVVLHLADAGTPAGPRLGSDTLLLRGMKPPGATVPFGPLWFLAVYLVVVILAPLTIRLHERFRWWVPAAMVAGAVAADAIGFMGGVHRVRWCNVVFVLLFPHQLGHFLGDGTLQRLPRRVFWAMVAVGLGGLLLLTNPPLWKLFGRVRYEWFPGIGTYPKSLLGTDVERVSNAFPPTLCFLMAAVWSIGAAMLLRPALQRWLRRPRPWRFTIGERRDHDAVPVVHDRVPARDPAPLAARPGAAAGLHAGVVGRAHRLDRHPGRDPGGSGLALRPVRAAAGPRIAARIVRAGRDPGLAWAAWTSGSSAS